VNIILTFFLESHMSNTMNCYYLRLFLVRLYVIVILFTFIACKNSQEKSLPFNNKDSVIRKHLNKLSQNGFYDTSELNYKIINAYANNDTSFFIALNKMIDSTDKDLGGTSPIDSCVHLKKLNGYDADGVYRVWHRQTFCDYGQVITIWKKNKQILLHYVEYGANDYGKEVTYTDRNGIRSIGPGCKIVDEFVKELKPEDWENLEDKIQQASFWELKQNYPSYTLDGSFWKIDAYVKSFFSDYNPRAYSVTRNTPISDCFKGLGYYFFNLASQKTMCKSIE